MRPSHSVTALADLRVCQYWAYTLDCVGICSLHLNYTTIASHKLVWVVLYHSIWFYASLSCFLWYTPSTELTCMHSDTVNITRSGTQLFMLVPVCPSTPPSTSMSCWRTLFVSWGQRRRWSCSSRPVRSRRTEAGSSLIAATESKAGQQYSWNWLYVHVRACMHYDLQHHYKVWSKRLDWVIFEPNSGSCVIYVGAHARLYTVSAYFRTSVAGYVIPKNRLSSTTNVCTQTCISN